MIVVTRMEARLYCRHQDDEGQVIFVRLMQLSSLTICEATFHHKDDNDDFFVVVMNMLSKYDVVTAEPLHLFSNPRAILQYLTSISNSSCRSIHGMSLMESEECSHH